MWEKKICGVSVCACVCIVDMRFMYNDKKKLYAVMIQVDRILKESEKL